MTSIFDWLVKELSEITPEAIEEYENNIEEPLLTSDFKIVETKEEYFIENEELKRIYVLLRNRNDTLPISLIDQNNLMDKNQKEELLFKVLCRMLWTHKFLILNTSFKNVAADDFGISKNWKVIFVKRTCHHNENYYVL